MKKHLLVLMLAVACVSLFADVTPYGSARVGIWYAIGDEDHAMGDRMDFDMSLQESSHFGIDWTNRNFDGKVEINGLGELDQLWVRRNFNCWKLTFGLMEDGTNVLANQAFYHDLGLEGYGAVYGGTNPAIRLDHQLGIYLALIAPSKIAPLSIDDVTPVFGEDAIDAIIPRVNLGWEGKAGKVGLRPNLVFQMYSVDKERTGIELKEDVVSYLGSMSVDYEDGFGDYKFRLLLNLNYGQNTGNMGYAGPSNMILGWDHHDGTTSTANVTTLGGFFQFGFDINKNVNLNAGAGYASSDSESKHFAQADDRMAFYLQGQYNTAFGLSIVPEFGMMMENESKVEDEKEGTMMYFGAQLRYNF